MLPALDAIFGNRTAASTLLFIENAGEGYASSIAKTFDFSVSLVQDQLKRLEAAGVLVSRTVGRTRIFEFNPRNPLVPPLRDCLSRQLELLPDDVTTRYFRQRARPRRSGKPLGSN